MAKDTTIKIRVDRDLKEAAVQACAARGSTISAEFRAFLAWLVKGQGGK